MTDRIPHADQSNWGFRNNFTTRSWSQGRRPGSTCSPARLSFLVVIVARPLPRVLRRADAMAFAFKVVQRFVEVVGVGTAAAFSSTSSRPFRRSTALRRSLWPNHPAFLATGNLCARDRGCSVFSKTVRAPTPTQEFKADLHPLHPRSTPRRRRTTAATIAPHSSTSATRHPRRPPGPLPRRSDLT